MDHELFSEYGEGGGSRSRIPYFRLLEVFPLSTMKSRCPLRRAWEILSALSDPSVLQRGRIAREALLDMLYGSGEYSNPSGSLGSSLSPEKVFGAVRAASP